MKSARPAIVLAVGACATLAISSTSCRAARPLPSAQGAASVPTSPEALLALVRAREDAVSTLRARFTVEFQQDAHRRRKLDGVVVVRKPDAFRMSLVSPFGLTVFDHVAHGQRSRTRYPMGAPDGESSSPPLSHAEMAQAFLRGAHAFPGECRAHEVGPDTVEYRCTDVARDHYRTLTVARAGAHILLERSFTAGHEQLRIAREDYRHAGRAARSERPIIIELPWRITLTTPGTDRTSEIAIRDYEIDPDLADSLFALDAP